MTTTEKYFTALGWVWLSPHTADERDGYYGWVDPEGVEWPNGLPNITQSYPDFKKWVLEKMEGEGYEKKIDMAIWMWTPLNIDLKVLEQPIHHNEILEAAVIAATIYFENKVV